MPPCRGKNLFFTQEFENFDQKYGSAPPVAKFFAIPGYASDYHIMLLEIETAK